MKYLNKLYAILHNWIINIRVSNNVHCIFSIKEDLFWDGFISEETYPTEESEQIQYHRSRIKDLKSLKL